MIKSNFIKKLFIVLPLGTASLVFAMEKGKAPIEKSYWINPETFLAGAYPEKLGGRENISKLLDTGMTVFIDLTEPEEKGGKSTLPPYEKMLEEEAKKRGLTVRYYRMPIKDHEAPSQQEMEAILDHIDTSFAEGRKVYLHCKEGVGRTPTVAVCHFIRHGRTSEEALGKIREASGRPIPRRETQRKFIETYGKSGQETFAVISKPSL